MHQVTAVEAGSAASKAQWTCLVISPVAPEPGYRVTPPVIDRCVGNQAQSERSGAEVAVCPQQRICLLEGCERRRAVTCPT
jgi:hypothetical protein